MPSHVAELSTVCRAIGTHVPLWTQGAGGNVSLKDDGVLWVKASGLRLDAVREEIAIAKVRLPELIARLQSIDEGDPQAEVAYAEALTSTAELGPFGRPSMEAGMHAVLPGRWVSHFHSLPGILLGHVADVDPVGLKRWLEAKTSLRVGVLAPKMPGFLLYRQLVSAPVSDAFILSNHGVVHQGDSSPGSMISVHAAWEALESRFCADFSFRFLVALAETADPLSFARAQVGPTPFRIYFPDTAVFRDRIERVLCPSGRSSSGEALFELCPDAWWRDVDAAEIWLATQILFHSCPALKELPACVAQSIQSLPTERFRRDTGAR